MSEQEKGTGYFSSSFLSRPLLSRFRTMVGVSGDLSAQNPRHGSVRFAKQISRRKNK
jgi:hypothetical protein